MKKLGILLDNFAASDIAICSIYEGNRLDKEIDLCGFYIDLSPICANPEFAIMEAAETMTFYGPIIATSVRTANYLRTNSNNEDKFYYIWDLEWVDANVSQEEYSQILKEMKIIARNDYIANWLYDLWGRQADYITDGFDLSSFVSQYNTETKFIHKTLQG